MIKRRNKAEEENYKINLSDMNYRRQLLLSKVKMFKKDLNHLKRKNSYKFHLELPLYNFFLNMNYYYIYQYGFFEFMNNYYKYY